METWAAEAPALGWGDMGVLNIASLLRQVSRELLPSTSLQAGCRNSFVEPGQIERLLDDDCNRDPSLHIRCVAGDEHNRNVAVRADLLDGFDAVSRKKANVCGDQ